MKRHTAAAFPPETLIEALAANPLFESIERRELAALAGLVVVRSFPRHTILVSEGEQSSSMYFVLTGRVKIYVTDRDARELVLDTMGPGGYFGEIVLDGRPRSASVMTVEPTRAAILAGENFRSFLGEHPDTAFALILHLIAKVRTLTESARDLALLDVYGRVIKLLMSLSQADGDHRVIRERLTKKELGDRVGASREMVTRILKDLVVGDYISVERGRITILKTPPSRW